MIQRYRGSAAAGASFAAVWLSLTCAALAAEPSSRQIVVEPGPAEAQPDSQAAPPAPTQSEAPAPAEAPATAPGPAVAPATIAAPPQGGAPGPAGGDVAASGPPADCGGHKYIQPEDVVSYIAADLDRLKSRAKGTRYLTLTHFANVCTPDDAMEAYRQGAIKLVNSLSRSSEIVKIEPIDPDRSILRINIDDLGWDPGDWDNMLLSYPYGAQPDTKLFAVLQAATATKLAYVRADWFAFTASRPPLYNALLKLPKTYSAFAQQQGVDVAADIKRFVAQRAGFQRSGESQNNRLIERHPSRSGYFWTTYDFAGNRAKQSLFEFPLGPGGQSGFDHDGSETVFSLPNGFVGYYIATAKGDAIDSAPTTIVQNIGRRDVTVTTGISCMGCHSDGIRVVADEVRENILGGRSFSKEVRDAVDALYPPADRMNQMFDDDGKRFASAMGRAGLDSGLRLGNSEPINALSERFEGLLDARLAAAELGLTTEDFVSAVNDNRRYRPMVGRLNQGKVSRGEFEGRFAELITDLTDEEMIKFEKPKVVVAPPPPPKKVAPAYAPPAAPAYAPPRGRSSSPYSYQ